ncbi:MAG: Fe-Mn family superoxide dismutase [Candidatus Obscuribacterales bacterium]|nr:Fe-Mn family superoxide dismutase [Candidatus Obscuribacterales bacterium]
MTTEKREVIGNYEVAEGKLTTRREVLLMGALAAGSVLSAAAPVLAAADAAAKTPAAAAGEIKEKDFSALLSKKMDGLSSNQIEQHLKLYKGYVTKTKEINALLDASDILTQAPAANATYAPFRELLMEQSFALNGVVYHELYFGNLGGAGGEPTGDLKAALEAKYGSVAKFVDYLKTAGKCMRGWVIVGWNTRDSAIHTYGLDTHNMWSPAGVLPIVALDVYEHAYMIDYGINRANYLDAFLKNIDWEVCGKRFNLAHKHPSGADSTT